MAVGLEGVVKGLAVLSTTHHSVQKQHTNTPIKSENCSSYCRYDGPIVHNCKPVALAPSLN